MEDIEFMQQALTLSLKGTPSPNPYVGCVLVMNNKIIGEGYHKKFGHDHAEIVAIKDAKAKGNDVRGSTMYVTLEPCSHYGKTSPCVDSIIKHKISEVYISMKDPNPQVNGKGIEKLKKAGVKVNMGLLANEAKTINEIFIKHIKTTKPFVVLKAAISLDGKIATKSYDSKWISNKASRDFSRIERAKFDAILVGINTIIKDNPKLTATGKDPLRVILDSRLRIPLDANVIKDDNVLIVTTGLHDKDKKEIMMKKGIKILICGKNKVNLNTLTDKLGKQNITSLLVEGGSTIITSFIKEKIADKINFYISPILIGAEGIPLIGPLKIYKMNEVIKIKNLQFEQFENNLLLCGYL